MIQSKSAPKYRIRYKECTQNKGHEGEKMNFVCLNEKCNQNSLICSMCREESHKGHITQPLKFYIQNLKLQYENDRKDYSKQFESLEQSRSIFLVRLRETVEKVAEEFRKLEQETIERFSELKNQLIENQSRMNKFSQFYESLTHEGDHNPDFLIRNYLPTKQSQNTVNFEIIKELGDKLSNLINETRHSVSTDSNAKICDSVIQNIKLKQKIASSVTKTGNLYTQTNFNPTAETLSAITVDLAKNFQKVKIKIRISKMKKGGSIFIGAIESELFKQLNNHSPGVWNDANLAGKIFYYNNMSYVYGQTSSQLKAFSQNSNMEITVNGQIMKIAMKKNSAEFNIPTNGEFYFFFCLHGQTQVQVTYATKQQ